MAARGPAKITTVQAPVTGPFDHIACGVNGTRASAVAVEQALELAEDASALEFIAVTDVRGTGPTRQAGTGIVRCRRALDAAHRAAADRGIHATAVLRHHPEPRRALLESACERDLLVIGAHHGSRAGGIMVGSTATLALHECNTPVLIARAVPGGRALAERVLVATTGSGADRHAAELGAVMAARAGGSVTLLHLDGDTDADARHELAVEASDVFALTGTEPVVVTVRGHGPDPIVQAACDLDATLLVLGSRGRAGVRALTSISERVGAAAPCSVLVIRRQPG